MKIYIDNEYKCHASDGDGLRAFECGFFDGKCEAFIDGYRFVPQGESWTREDGEVFMGEMAAPWKPYAELEEAQKAYENEELLDMKNALNALGVNA